MALHASAKIENVKRSVEKYLYDNLYSGSSIALDLEGFPFESGVTGITTWIQSRIMDFNDPTWKPKSSSTRRGNEATIMLNNNIFVKKDWSTSASRHWTVRDTLAGYLYSGVSFTLRDYIGGTTVPRICLMYVQDIISDTSIPNEEHWQWNYTVSIKWLREWPD